MLQQHTIFLPYIPENSIIIGDKGYVSKKLKSFLDKFKIKIAPVFRNKMEKDREYFIKRKIRKGIETAFSIITSKFGKVIKTSSINGFLIKLKLFILSYSINCFLKLDDNQKNLLFK